VRVPAGTTSIERLRLCTRSSSPFFLEVGDVLVDRRQRLQIQPAGDLFKGRRVAVAGDERLQEVENLFLSASNCHARILANEKRNCQNYFRSTFSGYSFGDLRRMGRFPLGLVEKRPKQKRFWEYF
jgi:hypothetical protein